MTFSLDLFLLSLSVSLGLLDKAAIQTRQICPTFANFKFNCTDPSVVSFIQRVCVFFIRVFCTVLVGWRIEVK